MDKKLTKREIPFKWGEWLLPGSSTVIEVFRCANKFHAKAQRRKEISSNMKVRFTIHELTIDYSLLSGKMTKSRI
jgi:hypothetical protein